MKRLKASNKVFALFIVIGSLFIGFASHSITDAETATFSGRVVDAEGNPVAKLPVMIVPAMVMGSGIRSAFFPMQYSTVRRALTDADGRFFITDIAPGISYFGILPYDVETFLPDELATNIAKAKKEQDIAARHASGIMEMEDDDFEPDVEVLSLRIQGITFYPRTDHEQIGFSVKPGTHIENVEVTVQPRMRIRGRIVFKDGTPLANARLHLRFRFHTVDGTGNGQSGGEPRTDAEGYFVYYLDEKDDPAFYTFSVEYEGLSAKAGPIRLDPGERLDGLTLKFDSEPIVLQPPSHTVPQPPSHIAPQALPDTKTLDRSSTATPPPRKSMRVSEDVWVVNPANLHAYKRIHCETRDDAVARAKEENAHLVTINDAAEQVWLSEVFERKLYWIGLSRVPPVGASSDATQWRWESGEPITYSDWLPDYIFGESLDVSERVYAVMMTFNDGKWYAVGPDSLVWRMTEMAILEKTDVLDNPSAAEK
ncbi:MAG: lectin-like protein [Candidatus Poribacteria bacterium]|nr:lectin-like protein [Candidatus Poribacteria bacterium]